MSDIKKCTGGNCSLRMQCMRYFPAHSHFQDYYKYPPFKTRATGTHECKEFIQQPKNKVWKND